MRRPLFVRRSWISTLVLALGLAVAMAATLGTPLGFSLVEYNVAFGALVASAAAAWGLLARRRFATLAMAYSGAVATITGFAMLYTVEFAYKEWLTWWHSATSFAFLLAFLVHWLHNRVRLWGLTRKLFASQRAPAILAAAAWTTIALLLAWSWLTPARLAFTRERYLAQASWAVLASVLLAYGIWWAFRIPTLRARLTVPALRNRARGLVDTSLFLANWGALLTGLALLYFADALRGGELKYVSKWWHTATSAAFLAFLALHVGFNARLLAAHARRVDGRGPLAEPPHKPRPPP